MRLNLSRSFWAHVVITAEGFHMKRFLTPSVLFSHRNDHVNRTSSGIFGLIVGELCSSGFRKSHYKFTKKLRSCRNWIRTFTDWFFTTLGQQKWVEHIIDILPLLSWYFKLQWILWCVPFELQSCQLENSLGMPPDVGFLIQKVIGTLMSPPYWKDQEQPVNKYK